VVIWHNWAGSYADAITKLLGEYADQNNVALELLNVPDLNQKVNVAIPAGQGPDVIAWVNDQIGKNAELGVIQPLGDKGIDRAYLEQNFVDTAVNAMEYQDKIWGVPESMESIAFIYNKDLVSEDKLPKSTDELLQKAKEFNQANQGKYYFVYQAGSAAGDAYHNAPWWYGNGAFYVDEEGKVGLASPESTRAGELLKQFSTIMPAQIDADVSRALFTEGNAAIWMTGPWSIADVEKAGINYGIATIPQISASGKPGQPFVGVKTMMLAEGAKNQESALNLMKYYGSKEFQAKLAQANKQVPANKAAQEQVKSDPVIAAFIEQTRNGTPLPNTPFMDALWAPTGEAQAAIWSGAQAPEAALKAAAEVATEKIEQIR
jgi:arabinogalactan oligomer/maltooligosaccharide transport system substrate-binding protein